MKKLHHKAYRIMQERMRQLMTQEDLAKRIGVCLPTMIKIEKGEETTSVRNIAKVADELGVPYQDIIADFFD